MGKGDKPNCPYCQRPALLVSGAIIYPHLAGLHAKMFWQCAPCDAYVGCHEKGKGFGDGTRPLGRLADAELRKTKVAAHRAFDALWQSGQLKRRKAYAWFAKRLGIQPQDCHIGEFDLVTCRRVVGICNEYRRQSRSVK